MYWTVLNHNMNPAQKAAAVAMKLRGSAARLAESIPPQILVNGAVINGVQIDPMSYIMHTLSEHYARLGEEQQLTAFADFMNFDSLPGERIEDLLIRFDETRERAQEYGGLAMNVTGVVYILIRSLKLSADQFTNLWRGKLFSLR